MRKTQRLELALAEFGAAHPCPVHGLPLFRHLGDSVVFPDGQTFAMDFWPNEGCWDCPEPGCRHHVHENPPDSELFGPTLLPEHIEARRLKEATCPKNQ